MSYPFPPDLQTLVGDQMASGKYASEDDLLRSALHALAEEEQDLDAVRESLDEWRAVVPGVLIAARGSARVRVGGERLQHKEEVARDHEKIMERINRGNSAEVRAKLHVAHERLLAMRKSK